MQIHQIISLFNARLNNSVGTPELDAQVTADVSKQLGDTVDSELYHIARKVWQCRSSKGPKYITPYTKQWYQLFQYKGHTYSYTDTKHVVFSKKVNDAPTYAITKFFPEDFLSGDFEQMIDLGLSR